MKTILIVILVFALIAAIYIFLPYFINTVWNSFSDKYRNSKKTREYSEHPAERFRLADRYSDDAAEKYRQAQKEKRDAATAAIKERLNDSKKMLGAVVDKSVQAIDRINSHVDTVKAEKIASQTDARLAGSHSAPGKANPLPAAKPAREASLLPDLEAPELIPAFQEDRCCICNSALGETFGVLFRSETGAEARLCRQCHAKLYALLKSEDRSEVVTSGKYIVSRYDAVDPKVESYLRKYAARGAERLRDQL